MELPIHDRDILVQADSELPTDNVVYLPKLKTSEKKNYWFYYNWIILIFKSNC